MKPDLEGARRLMQAAGQQAGFALKTIVPNYVAGLYINIAEFLNAALKQINIDLQLDVMDNNSWSERFTRGEFDAWVGAPSGIAGNTAGTALNARFLSNGPRNKQGLADPRVDELIRQQATLGRDPAARKRVLGDLARYLLVDQPGVYPLLSSIQDFLAWPYVKNLHPNLYGTTYEWFNLLWLEK
jgi:ABC-type transport system substrate-binding protein